MGGHDRLMLHFHLKSTSHKDIASFTMVEKTLWLERQRKGTGQVTLGPSKLEEYWEGGAESSYLPGAKKARCCDGLDQQLSTTDHS